MSLMPAESAAGVQHTASTCVPPKSNQQNLVNDILISQGLVKAIILISLHWQENKFQPHPPVQDQHNKHVIIS